MPKKDVPIANAMRVLNHRLFGLQVIKWALMRPEDRPADIGQLKQSFPEWREVLHIPSDTVSDSDPVTMVQGTPSSHVIDLPPLYKLLPMLDYLEQTWRDYVDDEGELGFDPRNPDAIDTVEGGSDYTVPEFYSDYLLNGNPSEVEDLFHLRVGDYSYNGCR